MGLHSVLKRFALAGVALSIAVGSMGMACQRSNEYSLEGEPGEDGYSYYNRPGVEPVSPTHKVAFMGQPKKRVLIFNFWNNTPIQDPTLGDFAANELRRGVFLTHKVILPTKIQTNLQTSDFVRGDRIQTAQLIREGRRRGVAVVVVGRIADVVFRQKGDTVGILRQNQSMVAVDLELKVFDISGGREIMALSQGGEVTSNSLIALEGDNLETRRFRSELTKLAIRDATAKLIPGVVASVEKLHWRGQVAEISGGKIYLNAGKASGLVAGDILKVMTAGDDVYDPVTGAYLGNAKGQMKGTVEVREFMGEDGAVGVVHTGGQFQKGDVVQLY